MNNLSPSTHHCINDLIDLFDQTFEPSFNTRLIKGNDEPIYLPASDDCLYHQIIFAHGFFSSALHEISHWCLAGKERRLKEDFGYWYLPDGRDAKQQENFEHVEIKPQAIEWALSVACGHKFDVSVDNLNGDVEPDRFAFKAKVLQQVQRYLLTDFPAQADTFITALADFYYGSLTPSCSHHTHISQCLLHQAITQELAPANMRVLPHLTVCSAVA